MKRNYYLSKITTFILCFIILISTTTAFAASTELMSYSGKGILEKSSISHFELSKKTTFTINHHQKVNDAYAKYEPYAYMDVILQKKGAIKYNNIGDSVTCKGTSGFTKSYTKDKGKYRLHFASHQHGDQIFPRFDINGTVKRKSW